MKTHSYVLAKVRALREFGYPKLTPEEVEKQLGLLLAGKQWTTVIGAMMESDNCKPVTP